MRPRLGQHVAAALLACAFASACDSGGPRSAGASPVVAEGHRSLCDVGARQIEARMAPDHDRPFLLSVPRDGGRGRPLVVALHGSGGTPAEMEAGNPPRAPRGGG